MQLLSKLDLGQNWPIYSALGLAVLLAYGYWPYRYWRKRAIPGPPMLPLLGNMIDLARFGFKDLLINYPRLYGKVYGTYMLRRPVLVVGDVDMVKQVCIKQADCFTNRMSIGNETKPLSRGITVLQDQEWKHVRNLLTPSFSSGKIKAMFPLIERCTQQLCRSLLRSANQPVDIKSYFMNFSMDAVASTLFGLQINTQEEDQSEFKRQAGRIFNFSFMSWKFWALFLFPGIMAPIFKKLDISLFPKDSMDFFQSVVSNALKEREASADSGKYNDFLASMVAARQEAERQGAKGLTEDEVLAQSITFFLAGFETTANAMQYLAYFFALNPGIQDKAFREVRHVADNHGGQVTYESLKELHYLNQCFEETMRMCPPALLADRVCKEATVVKGYEIEEGVVVQIPIYFLAHDPDVWENPDSFDPDRFSPDLVEGRDPVHLIPFGLGPRNCIGMRLAQLEIRKSMAEMLLQMQFCRAESTPDFEKLEFRPAGLLSPKEPIQLLIKPRN